jgi:MFS transporter, PAT family, beta-lactamase induction signal transducer AmpG
MAIVTATMTFGSPSVSTYVIWGMLYAFITGLAYAAFTAFVLVSMGPNAAATKYNVFASLSNFPIWWVGLFLGWTADRAGPNAMLWAESVLGIVGVLVFAGVVRAVRRSKLPA